MLSYSYKSFSFRTGHPVWRQPARHSGRRRRKEPDRIRTRRKLLPVSSFLIIAHKDTNIIEKDRSGERFFTRRVRFSIFLLYLHTEPNREDDHDPDILHRYDHDYHRLSAGLDSERRVDRQKNTTASTSANTDRKTPERPTCSACWDAGPHFRYSPLTF